MGTFRKRGWHTLAQYQWRWWMHVNVCRNVVDLSTVDIDYNSSYQSTRHKNTRNKSRQAQRRKNENHRKWAAWVLDEGEAPFTKFWNAFLVCTLFVAWQHNLWLEKTENYGVLTIFENPPFVQFYPHFQWHPLWPVAAVNWNSSRTMQGVKRLTQIDDVSGWKSLMLTLIKSRGRINNHN